MKPTEHNAQTPFTPKAGRFATLRGVLHTQGTRAPTAGRARVTLTLLAAVTALVCLAPASASAAIAHEYKSSFGPDCTEASQFEQTGAVAVDESTHDIYVADLGAGVRSVFKCTANGEEAKFTAGPGAGTNHIAGFSFTPSQGASQIAVSPISHDFYVVDKENLAVKAFAPDGEEAEFTAGAAAGSNQLFGFLPQGVAVDANGDIYVASALGGPNFTGAVAVFAPDGEELTSFETSQPANLAVDAHGDIYVTHEITKTVEKLTPSVFPVTSATTYPAAGTFADGGPDYTLALDPVSGDLYFDQRPKVEHSQLVQRDGEGNLLGTFAAPGEPGELEDSEGLAVDGSTGVVYAADSLPIPNVPIPNARKHQVRVYVPAPLTPPSVGESATTSVSASSGSVEAQVNPEHFDTHYRFQYLTEAAYEANGETFTGASETLEADLGSSAIAKPARAQLLGLAPDTTYVFRVEAENANNQGKPVVGAVSIGQEGTFHTYASSQAGLPDGRSYEMVSPAAKTGEVFVPDPDGPNLGGSCEIGGVWSTECYPGFLSQMMPMQSTPDGDAVVYEGYPFSAGLSSSANEYFASRAPAGWATQSLSSPLFANGTDRQGYAAFSPDLSQAVIYQVSPALSPETPARAGKSYADLYLRRSDGTLEPLVTTAPPNRPAGAPCERTCEEFQMVFGGGNAGSASSPAFSHLVFAANDALTGTTESAPAAVDGGVHSEANRPSGLDLYEWFDGQLRLVNVQPGNAATTPGAVLGSGILLEPRESTTADVDHAISDDGSHIFWSEEATGQVYVRIDGDETVRIEDPGKFLTASRDGSKVLLSDGCLYVLASKSCEADLSQGHGAPTFEGILGAAEDLSRVYFVDREALTPPGEKNAHGEHAIVGAYNLYTWHGGTTTFIAALQEVDNEAEFHGKFGDWRASSTDRLAQVTPDGTRLAFMSQAPLTGYDSIVRGRASCRFQLSTCTEVFEYDATSGKLSCASCNPTGLRPLGSSTLSLIEGFGGGGALPPFPQPNNLSADGNGRLFFESEDQLSPRDINGHTTDVYEWEPNDVGSCGRTAGCVFLISSGRSDSDSAFVDSSDSGNDAFFVTRSQLLRQDTNEQLDLYDARVGGGIAESTTAPCGGEGCKGSPPAGAPPASGSAAFVGPGNLAASAAQPAEKSMPKTKLLTRAQQLARALKACAEKPRAKRQACQAQARKRYGPVAKKSGGSKSNVKGRK